MASHERGWLRFAPYAAAVWSMGYGAFGLYWSLGGPGFPFGTADDPGATLSLLGGARPETMAPVIAVLGLAGAAVALPMAQGRGGTGIGRFAMTVLAWTSAVTLALLIPDYRVLAFVAYLPIVLLGAPFGWPPGASLADAVPWPIVNQLILIGGGLAWAGAAVAYGRRAAGACQRCGRSDEESGWSSAARAVRWGRWAVAIAVVIPTIYAITRYAWALGIPLGITREFLQEGQASGLWLAGAGLATVALVGAVFTLGLIQRWGEVFPAWLPAVGGKPVPSAVATIPALIVAALVMSAGLMFVRLTVTGGFTLGDGTTFTLTNGNWAALGPELLWPLWGVGLGAAAVGYHLRRRGPCPSCGRSQ